MVRFIFLTLFFCLSMSVSLAQSLYRARVVDAETGEGMPYVNVTAGMNRGAVTNLEGDFAIRMDAGDSLQLSFVGYEACKLAAADLPRVIKMKALSLSVGEVTVLSDYAILMNVYERMAADCNKRLTKLYFSRIAIKTKQGGELVESLMEANSPINVRDMKVLSGACWTYTPEGGRYPSQLQRSNLHALMQAAPMMLNNPLGSHFISPFPLSCSAEFLQRNYSVALQTVEADSGSRMHILDLKPKDGREGILSGKMYVDAETFRLLRFDGVLQGVAINLHRSDRERSLKSATAATRLQIVYDYSNGVAEVKNVLFRGRTEELDVSMMLLETELEGKPSKRGVTVRGNLIDAINEAGDRIDMGQLKRSILRTQEEEAIAGQQERSQDTVPAILSHVQKTMNFNKVVPQEKVYLHLDNNWYAAGDTIWYKAYLVRSDNHAPSPLSRILYVELLNEQGYLVERQQLRVDSMAQAAGHIALPKTAWPGHYELRSYTRWMLNFGDEVIYSKVLPVYEHYDGYVPVDQRDIPLKVTAGDYTIKYPLPKVNLHLYPEGGHVVYGLPSRMAFEVSNEETRRINLEGELLEDDVPIQKVQCQYEGRGCFRFIPRSGHQYQLRFVKDGEVYLKEIANIDEEGCAMAVDTKEDSLMVKLWKTARCNMLHDSLYVACRGVEHTIIPVGFAGTDTMLALPIETLPGGVNEVYLKDGNGGVLLSRKVFVNKIEEDVLRYRLRYDRDAIKPNGKVSLEIDCGAMFANLPLSIAITDKKQRISAYDTGNMMTELFLQSDIAGFVENAAWHLQASSEQASSALDLLMMVKGWSRYEWSYSPTKLQLNHPIEKVPSISGQMLDIKTRKWHKTEGKKALYVHLYLKEDSVFDNRIQEKTVLFKGSMLTDSIGKFRIEYEPFRGDAILQLTGFYAEKLKKKKYRKQLHDPHVLIKLADFHPKKLKQYSWYEINLPDTKKSKSADAIAGNSIILDGVTVNAKKRRTRKIPIAPVAAYGFNDFLNEYWDNSSYNYNYFFTNQQYDIGSVVNYLKGKVLTASQAEIVLLYDGKNHSTQSEIYKKNKESYSFLHRIDSIQVITDLPRRPTCYQLQYAHGANAGYINLQKYPDREERFVEGRYINLHGSSMPAQFYLPDYSQLSQVQDFRHTIYWNPSVKTDAQGKAKVEFFNNSTCEEMYISVEGMTEDGKVLVNE